MGQCQFRSDDSQRWWLGYGNGSDGDYSSAGNATDAPVDSSCSGTAGATSLSATNASFAAGKPILIHQTRGTGAGTWELNQIKSYVAGTITLRKALQNTYTDSGASQAQVIQLKQYNNFTQNSGHTLTAKAWNGDVGGIIAFLAKGTVTIAGTIKSSGGNGSAGGNGAGGGTGGGFRGGNAKIPDTGYSNTGEGTQGASTSAGYSSGGSGGGGCAGDNGGGGGGANGANGGNATGSYPGSGGTAAGNAGLTSMVFGGGGAGSQHPNSASGGGGSGGGIVLIIANTLAEITGSVSLNGGNGGTGDSYRDGGGGAGGSCLIKCKTATLGTAKITASAGSGGSSGGGSGSVGRIHLDYKNSYTGTTTPTIDARQDLTLMTPSAGGALLYDLL